MSEMVERVVTAWNGLTDRWFTRRNKMLDSQQWEVVHDWGVDVISDDTMKVVARFHVMEDAKAVAERLEDTARVRAAIAAMREPTEAMVSLGASDLGDLDVEFAPNSESRRGAQECWQTMIDASLT